jgi:cytosine/uracil/thiamine/allantoin permease
VNWLKGNWAVLVALATLAAGWGASQVRISDVERDVAAQQKMWSRISALEVRVAVLEAKGKP